MVSLASRNVDIGRMQSKISIMDLVERHNQNAMVYSEVTGGDVTEEVLIPGPKVGLIVGRLGCNLQNLRREFDVQLDLDTRLEPQRSRALTIIGTHDNVRRAIRRITQQVRTSGGPHSARVVAIHKKLTSPTHPTMLETGPIDLLLQGTDSLVDAALKAPDRYAELVTQQRVKVGKSKRQMLVLFSVDLVDKELGISLGDNWYVAEFVATVSDGENHEEDLQYTAPRGKKIRIPLADVRAKTIPDGYLSITLYLVAKNYDEFYDMQALLLPKWKRQRKDSNLKRWASCGQFLSPPKRGPMSKWASCGNVMFSRVRSDPSDSRGSSPTSDSDRTSSAVTNGSTTTTTSRFVTYPPIPYAAGRDEPIKAVRFAGPTPVAAPAPEVPHQPLRSTDPISDSTELAPSVLHIFTSCVYGPEMLQSTTTHSGPTTNIQPQLSPVVQNLFSPVQSLAANTATSVQNRPSDRSVHSAEAQSRQIGAVRSPGRSAGSGTLRSQRRIRISPVKQRVPFLGVGSKDTKKARRRSPPRFHGWLLPETVVFSWKISPFGSPLAHFSPMLLFEKGPFMEDSLTNCSIIAQNTTFHAHQVVLTRQSGILRKMLLGNREKGGKENETLGIVGSWKEQEPQRTVDLSQQKDEDVLTFLEVLYHRRHFAKYCHDPRFLVSTYRLAYMFGIYDVMDLCEAQLNTTPISSRSFGSLLHLAIGYGLEGLLIRFAFFFLSGGYVIVNKAYGAI